MKIGKQLEEMKLGTLQDLTTDPTEKRKKKKIHKVTLEELGLE